MRKPRPYSVLAGSAIVLLAGCSSSGPAAEGPQPVADGSYAFLASSAGGSSSATLEISGTQLTLAQDGASTSATIGAAAPEAVLGGLGDVSSPKRENDSKAPGEEQLRSGCVPPYRGHLH